MPLLHAGKVRELYALPDRPGEMLMVATDNISAFDFVLDSVIPDKGQILTQLSLWWFDQLAGMVANHVVSTDVPELVAGRAIVVEKLAMVPVECSARGYLPGSGGAEYQRSQTVCGIALPPGLADGSRLPEPLFTPSTKAALGGHDENVDFDTMCATTGTAVGAQLRDLTLAIYGRAEEIARERGIVLADTKFEFGQRADGTIVLADEVLTPDSSRFWDAADHARGRLTSFDKQFVRNWLLHDSGWDRASGARPPALPDEVIAVTRDRYREAFRLLTGREFVATPGSR